MVLVTVTTMVLVTVTKDIIGLPGTPEADGIGDADVAGDAGAGLPEDALAVKFEFGP